MKRKKLKLLSFSDEILFIILDYLDDISLLNISATCIALNKLAQRNWKIKGFEKLLSIVSP